MTGGALRVRAQDGPRSAYRVLERGVTLATVATLLALSGLAWWSTLGSERDMSAMVQGFAGVGTAMPFEMGATVFLAMWTTMMVAMMFPTIAPIVLMHRMISRGRGEGPLPTYALSLGYLTVWASVGVLPLAALIEFRHLTHASMSVDRAGGVVVVLAGLYQFTRWKFACLRACRSPLSFLLTHDFGGGSGRALRAGVSHGLYCLGCCWALMAVLFVVGLMNLAWMAAIAVVFLAEKNWRHGVGLTKLVGTVVVGFGIAVLIHPALLGSLARLKTGASIGSS